GSEGIGFESHRWCSWCWVALRSSLLWESPTGSRLQHWGWVSWVSWVTGSGGWVWWAWSVLGSGLRDGQVQHHLATSPRNTSQPCCFATSTRPSRPLLRAFHTFSSFTHLLGLLPRAPFGLTL